MRNFSENQSEFSTSIKYNSNYVNKNNKDKKNSNSKEHSTKEVSTLNSIIQKINLSPQDFCSRFSKIILICRRKEFIKKPILIINFEGVIGARCRKNMWSKFYLAIRGSKI